MYFHIISFRMHQTDSETSDGSGCPVSCGSYHVSLLSAALFDPAQLCQGQLCGDGGGQGQLVVGAGGPLQLQTWEEEDVDGTDRYNRERVSFTTTQQ